MESAPEICFILMAPESKRFCRNSRYKNFTLVRNNLCSALIGMAKPFIIDPSISKSSATPLNASLS